MTDDPTLGSCPKCGEGLAAAHVLVEYVKDGATVLWAEYPICDKVVNPQ
ncbi:hypothetical protein ACOZ4L_15635 (plasmid) [Haloplanus ruber]|uniref:DUF7837 domain-containing protein n=1 Tax=Haloplanus ruber TaxID=869892 RepID=A0ABD6CV42_9EURY|nr:hypothetical protein [Haloplanus ruber]